MKLQPPESAPIGEFILLFDGLTLYPGYRREDSWPWVFFDEINNYNEDQLTHAVNFGREDWCEGWLSFPEISGE